MNDIFTYPVQQTTLFIIGDFNLDMSNDNKTTKRLIQHMKQNNTQFSLNKTHTPNRPLIDHIWTNSIEIYVAPIQHKHIGQITPQLS